MNLPDTQTSDDAGSKLSRIGAVPSWRTRYDGEDVCEWIKAGWTIIALSGMFIAIPASMALGLPGANAVITYLAVNAACLCVWLLGLDAESTNLLYGRRTPAAHHAATGARRAMSIGIQTVMTIATLEMLVLAGYATTMKPLKHSIATAERARAAA